MRPARGSALSRWLKAGVIGWLWPLPSPPSTAAPCSDPLLLWGLLPRSRAGRAGDVRRAAVVQKDPPRCPMAASACSAHPQRTQVHTVILRSAPRMAPSTSANLPGPTCRLQLQRRRRHTQAGGPSDERPRDGRRASPSPCRRRRTTGDDGPDLPVPWTVPVTGPIPTRTAGRY